MTFILWLFLALGIAWLGTGALRRYALRRSLLDIPNDRSSHSVPTPRGGGVAIVLASLVVWSGLFFSGSIEFSLWCGLLGAGLLIAVTGFVDDHGNVSAGWRLVLHFLAVGWGVFWIGDGLQAELLGQAIQSPWIVWPLVVLTLVWLLNLYNFMDGIDGIASLEAVSVCLGGVLLMHLSPLANVDKGAAIALVSATLVLAASCGGFLLWNFPKARIFMGDAGSGFIGLSLGFLILGYAVLDWIWFWCWMILLGVFICDSTVTLFRRLLRGQKVYQAHRTHAYQVASRRHGSHVVVTLSVVVINLFWLLPWAWAVAAGWVVGELGLLLAWSPLIWLAFHYEAGVPEMPRLPG